MANDYFNHVANRVQAGTRAIAANVNSVADEIATGLDLLPTEDQLKLGLTRYAVDTGAADAYVLTMPYTPVLTDGFNLTFKAVNANTGASTLNVNATGAKSIVNPDGSALIANTFSANAIIIVAYESIGDRYILVSQNPAQSALAQVSAIAAAASAAAALVSEGNAATSETNAGTSASNASTSETNAGTSETNAAADAAAALADRLLFEQNYLGWKASDPTLDNEGNALIDGALYFNTTSNQMKVYDLGGTAWIFFQDGGDAASLDGLDSTQFLRSDALNTGTGTGRVLDISHTGTNGIVVNVLANIAARTDSLLQVIQDHASASITDGVVRIQQDGAGSALIIDQNSTSAAMTISANNVGSAVGVDLYLGGTGDGYYAYADGGGNAGYFQQAAAGIGLLVDDDGGGGTGVLLRAIANNTARTLNVVEIVQDHASSSAVALDIRQDGTGDALNVTGSTTITQSLGIDALTVVQNHAGVRAGYFYSNEASRTFPVVDIANDNATGFGIGLRINNDQGGVALQVIANNGTGATFNQSGASDAVEILPTNAGAKGLYVYANTATRTVPLVDIVNDNATGSGVALAIQQDTGGYAISLSGAGTQGINAAGMTILAATGIFTDMITGTAYYDDTRDSADGNPVSRRFSPFGSPYDDVISRNIELDGTTLERGRTGDGVCAILFENNVQDGVMTLGVEPDGIAAGTVVAANTFTAAIELDANGFGEAIRFKIDNDAGTLTDVCSVNNDGIVFANNPAQSKGIKFPATNVASTDANTLDDYDEGTWTPGFSSSGGTAPTASTALGRYTKIGRLVVCTFAAGYLANSGSPTGNAKITGLPFTVEDEQSDMALTISRSTIFTGTRGHVGGRAEANTTNIYLSEFNDGDSSDITWTDMDASSGTLWGTVSYFTDL